MSKKILLSSSIFSLMTLLSRILGLVRDIVVANIFGASGGYDAFVLAFRIPNLLRRMFAEGAFSQAFVPILSEYRVNKSYLEVKSLINQVFGNLMSILLIITLIGVIFAPIVIDVFAPGFALKDFMRYTLACDMLKITFWYLLFIALTAMCGGVLNTYDKFAIPAFTPVFLNISMIVFCVCFKNNFSVPEMALAWGVFFAGIIQFLFQLPFMAEIKFLPCPKISWQDAGVKRILKLMLPALVGASVAQINILVDTVFASFLPTGSITWLYYADRLMEFPLGIFGVGFATVALPAMSRFYAQGLLQNYKEILDWALKSTILIGLPATLGLYMLAFPLEITLFQSGKFSAQDALMSSQALMAYALSVLAIMLVKILASAFYARQDVKTPVKISILAIILNIILNAIFISIFAHAGLALATSLSNLFNALALLYLLLKRGCYKIEAGWRNFILRTIFANIMLVIAINALQSEHAVWLNLAVSARILKLGILVGSGVLVYSATLIVSGMRLKDLKVAS